MANPFRAARSKLRRANTHIAEAERLIATFIASRPFEMRRELVAIRGLEQLVLRQSKDIPADLEPVAADAIHNLGQALDHLICDLARLNRADDVTKLHFPFSKSADAFPSRLKQMSKLLRAEHAEEIAKLRPYPGGNDVLYALHAMDVSDKHRDLIAIGGAVPNINGTFAVYPPRAKTFTLRRDIFRAFSEGEPWLTFEPGSRVEYDITITADVAFRDFHGVRNHSVSAALREFSGIVESIIACFEPPHA